MFNKSTPTVAFDFSEFSREDLEEAYFSRWGAGFFYGFGMGFMVTGFVLVCVWLKLGA